MHNIFTYSELQFSFFNINISAQYLGVLLYKFSRKITDISGKMII